ncbi:MAG: hypothetical protein IAG10_02160 [Planctomycetaceae bacterium]|nr:hypothetical protein [Planctomycetaceae bacterium]
MHVRFKMFRGTFCTWTALFEDAAAFASRLPSEQLISISQSGDNNDGVVTVWYWSSESSEER